MIAGRNVDVQETTRATAVPENPIALLMYYLACLDSITNLNLRSRLVNYQNYHSLTPSDVVEIIQLCIVLDPATLARQGIFIWDHSGEVCKRGENRFFEITDRQVQGFIQGEVLIAGQRTRITSIMAFADDWIIRNYFVPLGFICHELGLAAPSGPSQRSTAPSGSTPPSRYAPTSSSTPLGSSTSPSRHTSPTKSSGGYNLFDESRQDESECNCCLLL
jgi:hypothetical protein